MIEPEHPRIEIDDLTAVIRESIAAQKQDGPIDAPRADVAVPSAPELKLQPDFQPRSNNRYHIGDLLRYHDRAFVENAYRAILKRPPDATEFARDLKRVRSGEFNKVDLLATLRYSTEGKAKGVELDGLRAPALVRQLGQLPLIGYLIRLVIALVRLPHQVRDQREFAGYVLSQNQQIADFINVLSARVAEVSQAVSRVEEKVSKQLDDLRDEHGTIRARQEVLESSAALRFDALAQRVDTQATLLESLEPRLESRIVAEKQAVLMRIEQLQNQTELLRGNIDQHAEQQQDLVLRQDQLAALQQNLSSKEEVVTAAKELRAEIERVYLQLQQARAELALQGRNLNSLLAPGKDALPVPPRAPVEGNQLDALYAALEDRFRGNHEEIKERFRTYLPYVEPVRDSLVIDLGCGRGEWLELLKENGINARGVEKNSVLIEQCRERGLEVIDDDVIAHLRSLDEASAGAITGFHIVEHVSIDALVSLLAEVMRVLRPGGVAIFETPNPENVLVGSNFFYMDPTHHHPLPRELMQFLFESRGFHPIEVLTLHPWDAGRVAGEGELAERFNGYFFGPMDYAILGWKG